jgi:hypothetical protein
MQVKMMKPGSNRFIEVSVKEQKIYEKQGWSLAVKKTEKKVRKKKVEAIEEPIIVSEPIVEVSDEQFNLDLNEEQD